MPIFYNDLEMFGAWVNTSDILEDMAEIDHMFCDKTGTLTKNELIFREMDVIGENKNSNVPE